jgi:hypothetical protein
MEFIVIRPSMNTLERRCTKEAASKEYFDLLHTRKKLCLTLWLLPFVGFVMPLSCGQIRDK